MTYVIELIDKSSGVVRYISSIKKTIRKSKVTDKFYTTHNKNNIKNSMKFSRRDIAEKHLLIALNNKEYWNNIYEPYIVKFEEED